MNWSSGDRALVIFTRPGKSRLANGSIVSLVSYLGPGRTRGTEGQVRNAWRVRAENGLFAVNERCLYPIDGDVELEERDRAGRTDRLIEAWKGIGIDLSVVFK